MQIVGRYSKQKIETKTREGKSNAYQAGAGNSIQKAGLGLDKFKLAIGLQSFSTLALSTF